MDQGRRYYAIKNSNKRHRSAVFSSWGLYRYSFNFIQDNVKLDKEPKFPKLTYSDTGRYECDVTMGLLSRKASFELVVEGKCLKETQQLWKMFSLTLSQKVI